MHAPASESLTANPHLEIRPLIAAIGGFCAGFGLLILISWHLHLVMLLQIRPTLPPMQYNTAICFVLAGAGLCAWGREPRMVSAMGALVTLIAGLTLIEYLTHTNLGLDQLFFRTYILTEVSNAGRMSPVSAFCFVNTGMSLLLLGAGRPPRGRTVAVGCSASIIVSLTLVAILGYALGLPGTYGWGQLTRIAAHTAVGLALVGAALFLIAWNLALRPGERTPRWLPVPLALGVFTGSLVLYFALEGKQNQEVAQTVKAAAEGVQNQIAVRIEGRIRSLDRMAERWEFSGQPPRAAWEADATNYIHDFPDLQAVEWIDASHRVRWIVPLAGNEAKLNLDLTTEARRRTAVETAEQEHAPVLTHIVTLFRGGQGFVLYVPIVVHGEPQGLLAAVFNARACLDRYLPPAVAAGEAIEVSENSDIFYSRDAETQPVQDDWLVWERVEMHGATWNVRVWPTPALAARLDSPLPDAVLCAGALASLLLGAVCYYAQRSSRQAIETARSNAALVAALDQVRTLEGLLPICSTCKRVRDDSGYWSQIESYVHQRTNASFSHGYCPQCAAKAFKECGFEVPESVQADLAAGKYD
jgi:sensor domain CHASE-containing protein